MNALTIIEPSAPQLKPEGLAHLNRVPPRHGVAVLNGVVVVYDESDLFRNDLVDGGYYVVEYQRPRACMAREKFAELFLTREGARLQVEREVVQVFAWTKPAGLWGMRHSRSIFVSGPMQDFNLTDMIVGKVIGIYSNGGVT